MRFRPARLDGAFVIEPEPHEDERGFFARIWDGTEFAAQGLDPGVAQISISCNRRAGTLRGLHFQHPPHEETKLVRATKGALFDVIVDLPTRPRSSTSSPRLLCPPPTAASATTIPP